MHHSKGEEGELVPFMPILLQKTAALVSLSHLVQKWIEK